MIPQTPLRQLFLISIILGLGYLLVSNLYFMVDAFLGAMILAILSQKPMLYLEKKKLKRIWAEWVYISITILTILIPITVAGFVLKNKLEPVYNFLKNYSQSIEIIGQKVNQQLGMNIVNEELIKSVALKISGFIPKILNSSVGFITTMGIMYFLLYYFIKEGSILRRGALSILPLNEQNKKKLYTLIYQSVLSNTLMMPMVAFAQAIIGYVSYLIIGLDNSFVWFLATFIASMIPFFGAGLIYIPLGILLFVQGQHFGGVFVLVWGFAVVSVADNFLRIFFMKKFDDVHPLITFLGVLAGLNIFGFWGIIYGPLFISLFLILIRIYREEYKMVNAN